MVLLHEAVMFSAAGMEAMTKALKHLYTVLSPEQRTIANQRLSMMGEQRMGMTGHAE